MIKAQFHFGRMYCDGNGYNINQQMIFICNHVLTIKFPTGITYSLLLCWNIVNNDRNNLLLAVHDNNYYTM